MNRDPQDIMRSFVNEMERIGYSGQTLNQYRSIIRKLLAYCDHHDVDRYNSSVGEAFIKETFQDVELNKSTARKANTYVRVINMLNYFEENGTIPFRFKKSDYHFPEWFQPIYEKFLAYRKYRGIVDYTIHKQHYYFEKFAAYLDNNGIRAIQSIDASVLEDYVASLSIFSLSVRYNTVSALRMFLLFLYEYGYVATNYKDVIPNVKYSHKSTILSVYSPEEIERLLECVDRGNATGKRDYAILLLAARLGLRVSDICGLTFDDIDWENSRICVLQKKTKETLQLPLSGEIGNAIIEYLRYGRPNSDFRTIFLRHHPPIRPIISTSVHCMIQRYFSAAGINTQGKRHGPHALRHSLATNMLKNDIPLPTISEVLGHTTTTSTQIYLKIDLHKLSKCALPVLGEEDSL